MGACASCLDSCLGVRQKDDGEHAPLLADSAQHAYAAYAGGYPPSPSAAPQGGHHQQYLHEREYLDRLVAQTSENLIDIFAPPMLTSSAAAGGAGSGLHGSILINSTPSNSSRGEWYRSLLEHAAPPSFSNPALEPPVVLDSSAVKSDERRWIDDLLRRGEEAVHDVARVREVGKLVVGLDID